MLFEKLKEAFLAMVPLVLVILVFYFALGWIPLDFLRFFLAGCVLLGVGLALFVVGAEVGLVPFGQAVGAALPHSRNMPLVLMIVFILGMAVAYADVDLHAMGEIFDTLVPKSSRIVEWTVLAVGLSTFVGVARILFKIPLKWLLGLGYAAVLVYACFFMDASVIGVAMAHGSGVTGPITVSLLMALGVGVTSTAKVSSGNSASFGLVGLLVLGVIGLAVLILPEGGTQYSKDFRPAFFFTSSEVLPYYLNLVLKHTEKITVILIPLVGLFVVFQFLFLKLPGIKASRMALGLFYTAVGAIFIMTGIRGVLIPCGCLIGKFFGPLDPVWLISGGALVGCLTVLLEPAVWVWTVQVANALGGSMKRFVLVSILGVSGGLGVALGLLSIVHDGGFWWLLPLGYGVALALMLCTPRLATGLAFDAGGVIAGPIFLFFVLTFVRTVSQSFRGSIGADAFMVIAFVAMVPLIAIQLLGLLFMRKEGKRLVSNQQKRTDAGV